MDVGVIDVLLCDVKDVMKDVDDPFVAKEWVGWMRKLGC